MNARSLLILVGALVIAPGCGKKAGVAGSPSTTKTATKTPPRPPPPPAPEQPPIRDVSTVSEPKDGIVVNVRLFAGTIASDDRVRFALGFALVGGVPKGAPLETIDTADTLRNLHFELTQPNGKTVTLVTGAEVKTGWRSALASLRYALELDGSGLHQNGIAMAWKDTATELTKAAGKYSLRITGTLETSVRKVEVASKPIEIEVVAKSASRKSLLEIETQAAALVATKESLKAPPKPMAPTIEDVNGNLWTRFQMSDLSGRYDMQVVEVLLEPSGKERAYDSYQHFTCIAEGTLIATPRGEVPVEELREGDAVISFDVERNVRSVSRVEQVERSHAETLFRFGRLRVTGSHPIFDNGEFRPASEVASGARLLGADGQLVETTRTVVSEPSNVYDLGVSAPHTYFAGGVLVHNKAMHVPIGGNNAPWDGWFYRRAAKH